MADKVELLVPLSIIKNLTLVPDYYTTYEGGKWKAWSCRELVVDDFYLDQKAEPGSFTYKGYIEIYYLHVHSLAFGDITGEFLRWDCINGFSLS